MNNLKLTIDGRGLRGEGRQIDGRRGGNTGVRGIDKKGQDEWEVGTRYSLGKDSTQYTHSYHSQVQIHFSLQMVSGCEDHEPLSYLQPSVPASIGG